MLENKSPSTSVASKYTFGKNLSEAMFLAPASLDNSFSIEEMHDYNLRDLDNSLGFEENKGDAVSLSRKIFLWMASS